jgi:hypothetical protein
MFSRDTFVLHCAFYCERELKADGYASENVRRVHKSDVDRG